MIYEFYCKLSSSNIFGRHLGFWSKFNWVLLNTWGRDDFRGCYFRVTSTSITDILLLDFWRFNAARLVNNICTLRNMSFSDLCSVLSTAIFALDVVVVVTSRRGRQIFQVATLFLKLFQLSHLFHSLLELFTLGFPFGLGFFYFLYTSKLWLCRFFYLVLLAYGWHIFNLWAFAHFFVFAYSIGCKFPATFSAGS